MGKSNNIFGAISGKIGGTIFYQRKNSKYNQGTRAYIADVANPQSMGQARQRMTMKAVQNLYSALAEVINRAYQSTAYGNPSRIKFLGNAMKNFQGPWLEKGSTAVIPFGVNLAEGTLGQIALQIDDNKFRSNLPLAFTGDYGQVSPSTAFDDAEVGGISKALLNAKGIVKEGDQLTIVVFEGVDAGMQPMPKVVSFIVDPNSVETIDDTLLNYMGENAVLATKSGFCAAAFILSREGLSGQHLRSTSPLVVNTEAAAIAAYFTDAQYQQAILSYMKEGTRGDWPVEPSDDENVVKSYVKVTLSSAYLTFHPVAGGAAVTPASPILVELQGYRTPGGSLGLFEQNGTMNLYKVYQNNSGLIASVVSKVTINDTECYVRLNTANPGEVRYVTVVG